jgi:hypothetical protein
VRLTVTPAWGGAVLRDGMRRVARRALSTATRGRRLEQEIAALRAEMSEQTQRIYDRVIEFEIRTRRDLTYASDMEAAASSSRFAVDVLVGARPFRYPWETLEYALAISPRGGMALEFGVATGTTLRTIAERRGGELVYGFDSFDGLPEDWITGMPAGSFARDDLPEVPGAELVVGLFDDTLAGFLDGHPGPVDFLHVDSDLYSSAATVLELTGPRLREGSVILFDEFFNYPGWQRHECRAWQEFVGRTGIAFDYLAYTYADCQLVAKVLATPGAAAPDPGPSASS